MNKLKKLKLIHSAKTYIVQSMNGKYMVCTQTHTHTHTLLKYKLTQNKGKSNRLYWNAVQDY